MGLKDGGATFLYDGRYEDIVPDVRIVDPDTMMMDGRRISASLPTVELLPVGHRTRLIVTEQIASSTDSTRPRPASTATASSSTHRRVTPDARRPTTA